MTDAPKPVLNIADLSIEWLKTGSRFEVGLGFVGRELGLRGLGATLHEVPAGKTAWPYHRHHVADELFVVLSGTGTYRIGEERIAFKAGDCLGAPAAGKAHQIVNTGAETLRYLAISNHGSAEVIEYPDSGRVAFMARPAFGGGAETIDQHGVMTETGFWDGEDTDKGRGE